MTFGWWRNPLTTHFSERIPVVKRRISVIAVVKNCFYFFSCNHISNHKRSPNTGSLFQATTTVCQFLPIFCCACAGSQLSRLYGTLNDVCWHMWIKSNPITSLDRPWGFQEAKAPRFQDNQYMKVVRLSALRTGCLHPARNIPGTHFC